MCVEEEGGLGVGVPVIAVGCAASTSRSRDGVLRGDGYRHGEEKGYGEPHGVGISREALGRLDFVLVGFEGSTGTRERKVGFGGLWSWVFGGKLPSEGIKQYLCTYPYSQVFSSLVSAMQTFPSLGAEPR